MKTFDIWIRRIIVVIAVIYNIAVLIYGCTCSLDSKLIITHIGTVAILIATVFKLLLVDR